MAQASPSTGSRSHLLDDLASLVHPCASRHRAFLKKSVLDQKILKGSVTPNHPNKIRATHAGGHADIEMLFDGKTLTLFGDCLNLYTQIEVPGTLDNLVDVLPDE